MGIKINDVAANVESPPKYRKGDSKPSQCNGGGGTFHQGIRQVRALRCRHRPEVQCDPDTRTRREERRRKVML